MAVQHVALEVAEADAAGEVAFWALLGFEEVDVPEGLRGRTRWVQSGPTQVHLLFTEDPVAPPSGHVAVVAADFAAACARLREAGHPVRERERHWGAERAFARTPVGHRVELMAFPPGEGAS